MDEQLQLARRRLGWSIAFDHPASGTPPLQNDGVRQRPVHVCRPGAQVPLHLLMSTRWACRRQAPGLLFAWCPRRGATELLKRVPDGDMARPTAPTRPFG